VAIRYFIDPLTDLPHIYRHNVTEDEVEWVLADSDDDFASGNVREAMGRTQAGRAIMVVYRNLGEDILVITAYQLEGKDLAAFRRRRRRRWNRRR
jgi:hypothetical protein